MTAAETLRRYWDEEGIADWARQNGHWELALAVCELAPPPKREVVYTTVPPVPFEGASCELHG